MGTWNQGKGHTQGAVMAIVGLAMVTSLWIAGCATGDGTVSMPSSDDATGYAGQETGEPLPVLLSEKVSEQSGLVDVPNWDDVSDVSAGKGIVFGMRGDGTIRVASVTSIGDGMLAELESLDDVTGISGNNNRVVVLHDDGTVTSLANDQESYPSDIASYDVHEDAFDTSGWEGVTQVSSDLYAVALGSDGMVSIAGDSIGSSPDYAYRIPDLSGWEGVTQVSTSGHLVAGLTEGGEVVTMMSVMGEMPQETTLGFLHGATDIAAMEGLVAGLMPDGTVRVADIDSPEEGASGFAVDGWTDIVSISAMGIETKTTTGSGVGRLGGHSGTVIGVRRDGTVLQASRNQLLNVDVQSWSSIRKAVLYAPYAAIGLCESEDVAKAVRTEKEDNTKWDQSTAFVSPDGHLEVPQEEIEAYDSEHQTEDGRWHGTWFSFAMPDGYEVAPYRKQGNWDGDDANPSRLVVRGSEDDFAMSSEEPVIEVGELRDEGPRGVENMDADGTYEAETSIEWQVFRITLYDSDAYERQYHDFTRYIAYDGDVSFTVTGRDMDDAVMREFLDGFEVVDDLVSHTED